MPWTSLGRPSLGADSDQRFPGLLVDQQNGARMPFPLPSVESDRSRPNRWRWRTIYFGPRKGQKNSLLRLPFFFFFSSLILFWQCLPKNDRCPTRTLSETSVFLRCRRRRKKTRLKERIRLLWEGRISPFMLCQATGSTLKRSVGSAPSIPSEAKPLVSIAGSTSLRGVAKSNFSTGKSPSPLDTFLWRIFCRMNPVGHYVFPCPNCHKKSLSLCDSTGCVPLPLFLLYYFQSVRYCPRFTRKTAVLALLSEEERERVPPR